jgi:transcriptional regulator with XRE-family HTH domain
VKVKLPRLKELREKRGLSQEALSELADVSRDSISSYERDVREAHPGTAKKLANALEIDVKNLVDMDKIEVEVRWEDSDGRSVGERLRFTGEEVDSYEIGDGVVRLYECPGGYRVLEEYDSFGGQTIKLYPYSENRSMGDLDYGLYTAEEVVQAYPKFGDTVGTMRVRDLD